MRCTNFAPASERTRTSDGSIHRSTAGPSPCDSESPITATRSGRERVGTRSPAGSTGSSIGSSTTRSGRSGSGDAAGPEGESVGPVGPVAPVGTVGIGGRGPHSVRAPARK